MQIQKLDIYDKKKCLENFHIPFHTPELACTNILIGENGTGKSTVMETILEILASFDSPAIEKSIDYSYGIQYEYAQKQIFIQRIKNDYRVEVDGMLFSGSYKQIRELLDGQKLFPKRIISFYSGANNKLQSLIQKMNTEYKKNYRQLIHGYLYVMEHVFEYNPPKPPVRKYNFCDEHMVPICLTAILAGSESFEKDYLVKQCRFNHIDRIDMIIDLTKVEAFFIKDRIRGNNSLSLVSDDPDHLFQVAEYIDNQLGEYLRRGWQGAHRGKGYLGIEGLENGGLDSVAILEFFELLHDLFGAKYEVYISMDNQVVNTRDLSEGQRQLIKILGMLGICKNEDCLILLDEPDAHMNPRWKYEIKNTMDQCLQKAQNAQAIIATHDPLVINGVDKEYIRIFDIVQGKTVVHIPTEDTVGMGIDSLLQSQYYQMDTTLDSRSQKKLDDKRALMVKRKEGTLTEDERKRLRVLTEELENMPFFRSIPADNYYDDFVAAVHELYQNRPKVRLTSEEIEERNRMVREIVKGLIDK